MGDKTSHLNLGTVVGCVALATDERDFGGDECQFLKQDGFALPMHKIGRQKTSRCSPPAVAWPLAWAGPQVTA